MSVILANFNSDEYSWADMEVIFAGASITTKIRGVRFKIESDDEELFAGGDEAISIQSGNIKKSGTLKILGVGLDAMQAAAVANGGRFVPDMVFDLVISYLPDPTRPLVTDTLGSCKFSSMEKGWDQGAKWMDCELPFKFLTYNGQ